MFPCLQTAMLTCDKTSGHQGAECTTHQTPWLQRKQKFRLGENGKYGCKQSRVITVMEGQLYNYIFSGLTSLEALACSQALKCSVHGVLSFYVGHSSES